MEKESQRERERSKRKGRVKVGESQRAPMHTYTERWSTEHTAAQCRSLACLLHFEDSMRSLRLSVSSSSAPCYFSTFLPGPGPNSSTFSVVSDCALVRALFSQLKVVSALGSPQCFASPSLLYLSLPLLSFFFNLSLSLSLRHTLNTHFFSHVSCAGVATKRSASLVTSSDQRCARTASSPFVSISAASESTLTSSVKTVRERGRVREALEKREAASSRRRRRTKKVKRLKSCLVWSTSSTDADFRPKSNYILSTGRKKSSSSSSIISSTLVLQRVVHLAP